jgi:predicted ribosome quality control (RQC) complex YloA/Tae2 family protein
MAAFRKYTSPGGYSVLVGRNSSQNDQLSLHVAQPSDVWMHARGVPGAHVLLRIPAGQQPGDADIQFAADLAAWFSRLRTDGRAEVSCAQPKDISKPKGAKPGQVVVRAEKVVTGRPQNSAAAGEGDEE